MEIKLQSESTIFLKGKSTSLILDPPKINVEDVAISGPGEYEVKGVQILGFRANSYVNYKIKIDGLNLAVMAGKPNQNQEEIFSDADVLILGQNQQDWVLKLEPKIVVIYKPEDAAKFLKEIGKEGVKPTSRLVIKRESLPGELEAVWLT